MSIACDLVPKNKDVFLISAPMSRELHFRITIEIEENKRFDDAIVFLTTTGGDPDGAYRIARCLKHHYKNHLRIVVPSYCKSAGTLLAIAANELAIGDFGELGPLDIQVSKPTELNEQSSCLDIQQALESLIASSQTAFRNCLMDIKVGGRLSTKLAGEFAQEFASRLFAPLMTQIDAQRLGEMARAQAIAWFYGERLDEYTNNLIREGYQNDALKQLIAGFPSHGFVIDRKEAKSLFRRVSALDKWEEEFFSSYNSILWNECNDVISFHFERIDNEIAKKTDESVYDPTGDAIVSPELPEVSGGTDGEKNIVDKSNVRAIQTK